MIISLHYFGLDCLMPTLPARAKAREEKILVTGVETIGYHGC